LIFARAGVLERGILPVPKATKQPKWHCPWPVSAAMLFRELCMGGDKWTFGYLGERLVGSA
jgi:hypothetical protein